MYPQRHPRPSPRKPVTEPVDDDDNDVGAATVEILSWAAMSVVVIVAIATALQVLGLDIIDYVRAQLGV